MSGTPKSTAQGSTLPTSSSRTYESLEALRETIKSEFRALRQTQSELRQTQLELRQSQLELRQTQLETAKFMLALQRQVYQQSFYGPVVPTQEMAGMITQFVSQLKRFEDSIQSNLQNNTKRRKVTLDCQARDTCDPDDPDVDEENSVLKHLPYNPRCPKYPFKRATETTNHHGFLLSWIGDYNGRPSFRTLEKLHVKIIGRGGPSTPSYRTKLEQKVAQTYGKMANMHRLHHRFIYFHAAKYADKLEDEQWVPTDKMLIDAAKHLDRQTPDLNLNIFPSCLTALQQATNQSYRDFRSWEQTDIGRTLKVAQLDPICTTRIN